MGRRGHQASPKASHQADLFWYDLQETSMVRSAVKLKKAKLENETSGFWPCPGHDVLGIGPVYVPELNFIDGHSNSRKQAISASSEG